MPEEIALRFPVGMLAAPNALLLMWSTWPLLERQLEVLGAWDFTFKSVVVWRKLTAAGKPSIGTGYRVRSMCEPVLVAVRGWPKHAALPGLFDGVRRAHSQKPEEFFALVDACCPRLKRRVELFARSRRPGWLSWGDEVDKFSHTNLPGSAS